MKESYVGPGYVVSEIAQGFRNSVIRGTCTPEEAQEIFNKASRTLFIFDAVNEDNLPLFDGEKTTQVEALTKEAQFLTSNKLPLR